MAAVRDQVSGEENLTGAQQHQWTRADVIATLALGPRPRITGRVVELSGVTRKFVSVHQYVAVRKPYGCAASATGVIQRSCRAPQPGGRVVKHTPAAGDQHFASE